VHETLSRNAEDDVPFLDILRPILRMAEESMVSPDQPIYFRADGDAGRLPAQVVTPLAVVLNELLQNAVDHAFPSEAELHGGHVKVTPVQRRQAADHRGGRRRRRAAPDFDLSTGAGLGLTIVRTLVETELGGTISVRTNKPALPRPGHRRRADGPARRAVAVGRRRDLATTHRRDAGDRGAGSPTADPPSP
jgi:two-component system, sensor histidine kinase PdtaS